jgi:hypothetical protein
MADFLRSTMLYLGAVAIAAGTLSLVKPLTFLRIHSRLRALVVAGVGIAGVLLVTVPTPATTVVVAPSTALDTFAPSYQFREVHETLIHAPPDRVFSAIKSVTADDISLFQTFTWIRRLGQPAPEGILNAPGSRPILESAVRGGFLILDERAPREIVFGTLAIRPAGFRLPGPPTPDIYRTLDAAGIAKATMNFLLEPSGTSTRLVTETRVFATDESSLRTFTSYWRVIYPGSAILRVTWLRAIKQRAEGYNPG